MPLPSVSIKNIVIAKHADINVLFPKMGIWVLSTLSDTDVVSIGATEITSYWAKSGKSYPILSVKEKWDYNFNPPYVFTGPFGTPDLAIAWAKSNPNQAVLYKKSDIVAAQKSAAEKAKSAAAEKAQAQAEKAKSAAEKAQAQAGGGSGGPQPIPTKQPTASELKSKLEKAISQKLPEIKKQQAKTLAKLDSLIASEKSEKKLTALKLLSCAFQAECKALDSSIESLKCTIDAYYTVGSEKPVQSVNGKSIAAIIEQCCECSAGALEALAKIVDLG